MIDIDFYQKVYNLKYKVMGGEKFSREFLLDKLEEFRNPEPVVYNIETTNACNMRCEMCPRTTMMTRPNETMEPALFEKVVKQLRPWSAAEWAQWEDFVLENYKLEIISPAMDQWKAQDPAAAADNATAPAADNESQGPGA